MTVWDRELPVSLTEVNALGYDGVDFEPYPELESAEETAQWLRAWTRNDALDGAEFRLFGQDGTGGMAAFWLVRDGAPLAEQPIVFFGSEGELSVIASHLGDYLWLLAGGFGPYEACTDPDSDREIEMDKAEVAARYAQEHEKPAREVIRLAKQAFPDFASIVEAMIG